MKKLKTGIAVLTVGLVMFLGFNWSTNKTVEAQTTELSGEEIFKGFIFGQGELGKNLSNIFSEDMLNQLNNKETKEFSNYIVKNISQQNPQFFNELKDAVYNENPQKVDNLLTESVSIVRDNISKSDKEFKNLKYAAERAGIEVQAETVSYNYNYTFTASGLLLAYISTTNGLGSEENDFNNENAIDSLINYVN